MKLAQLFLESNASKYTLDDVVEKILPISRTVFGGKMTAEDFMQTSEGVELVDNYARFVLEKEMETFPVTFKKANSIVIKGSLKSIDNIVDHTVGLTFEENDVIDDPHTNDSVTQIAFVKCNKLHTLKNINLSWVVVNECDNVTLKSFPSDLKKIGIYNCKGITSLRGIHDLLPNLQQIVLDGKVEGLTDLVYYDRNQLRYMNDIRSYSNETELKKALSIVEKHMGRGRQGVLDAHQELEDADLEDYS